MKNWILAGATLLLMYGTEAREPWGPPQACPKPKAECCPKPKCPSPCEAKPCKPKPACQPCPQQPTPPTQLCPSDPCCPAWPEPVLYAAYNYPAGVRTRCPMNVFVDASFLYWQAIEENLEVGFTNKDTGTTPFATAGAPLNATAQRFDFDYKPGFKVGVGGKFDYDNWDLRAEYTWFHGTNSRSVKVPFPHTNQAIFDTQGFPVSSQFAIATTTAAASNVYNSASAKWRLLMDLVDLELGRWYYSGTKLTFHPTLGMRAAFIGQRYNVTYTNTAGFGLGFPDVEAIKRKTKSWAIGPKVGLDSNWALGYGFRLFGNGAADLLYTRYTTLNFSETHTATTSTGNTVMSPVKVKDQQTGALRAHLDFDIGFGWGMYFDCNKYYWDIAAGYEYQVFFDQNMFRKFNDNLTWFSGTEPNGNLYIHGLTLTTRFDF